MRTLTRRDLLKISGVAAAAMYAPAALRAAAKAPLAPVAIGRCRTYDAELAPAFDSLFDKLGGLEPLVSNKTVAVKVNLTGGVMRAPGGRTPGQTYHVHPNVVLASAHAFAKAGARRIRFVEGWDPKLSADEFLGGCGWDMAALRAIGPKVEFENTNNRGSASKYSTLKVRHGGYTYPSFEINHSYEDTDLFVSLAKLKNHYTAGVTLALKNCFGVAPSSFYGDDAGAETARRSRGDVFHSGKKNPPAPAAAELHPDTSRDPGYRVPRITVDLVNAIHPIGLSIIEGVQSMRGGEGPWVKDVSVLEPGLLVAGLNPVCTDAVCTSVMGYDPAADRETPPFYHGDNTLKLAEAVGIGSADVKQIDVRGLSIKEALSPFESRAS